MKNWQNDLVKQFREQQTKFNEDELKGLMQRLPEEYYKLSDPDDILQNLKYLGLILHNEKNKIVYQSDIETFAVMTYDYTLLKNTIKEFFQENSSPSKLFRLYRDKDKKFFILGSYHILEGSPRAREANLQIPSWENLNIIKNNPGLKERIKISHKNKNGCAHLEMEILNTSMLTLSRNLSESLEHHPYSFIEIRMKEKLTRKIKSVFKVSISFFEKLEQPAIQSLQKDLKRYLQTYISYRSIFDIVGPAMVGPSSSHTAGANRIGQISRNIITSLLKHKKIGPIKEIKIKLIGSFRDTGVGHHTPEALIGGLCGLPTHDETMIKKGIEAVKNKEKFNFIINDSKIKFGGFLKGDDSDDSFYEQEYNSNIAEIIASTGKGDLSVTGFSIGGGNVEIRFINRKRLNEIMDGKKTLRLNYDTITIVEDDQIDDHTVPILPIDKASISPKEEYIPRFNTFEEMIEVFGENEKDKNLIQKILEEEKRISGRSEENIFKTLKEYWHIMNHSIAKGLDNNQPSLFQLTGTDANKILSSLPGNLPGLTGNIYGLALAYAISMNEVNAKSGLIVACPTGGSCGILPGVLKAWQQTDTRFNKAEKEKKILDALLVAGFFGMILFDDVPTAGADLGCQAEIGGGAAMTAAALAYVQGATLNQMIEAFTLALKNSMGLVCDPVAGLVEVPCVKRNGIYATVAISAAVCALAGVKSMISPDEVVLAVKEIGERMHDDYKETAKGGLAQTRDGKKINDLFHQATKEFFS
ncbi:MAG: L-serine ammonia-lyase, iron-sulfur-dependent, subunit alpha [Candidatus Aminicenantes bacterium]